MLGYTHKSPRTFTTMQFSVPSVPGIITKERKGFLGRFIFVLPVKDGDHGGLHALVFWPIHSEMVQLVGLLLAGQGHYSIVCFTVNCFSIELKFSFVILHPHFPGAPARHPMGTNNKARSRDGQAIPLFFSFSSLF